LRSVVFTLFILASATAPRDNTIRLLEWNVSDSAWVKNEGAARAVLKHADPDVVVLIQIHPSLSAQDVKRVLSGLRGPQDTIWNVSFRGGGALEHTAIASREAFTELTEFENIPFPSTRGDAQRAIPADPTERGVKASVPITAVTLGFKSKSLMIVGLHFTCCGTIDSWREQRRRIEADEVRKRIQSAMARTHPDGVIVAGDMNLVTGRAALDTILESVTERKLAPMIRVDALHLDGWSDWTWDGRGTQFNGGRLDNVAYSSGSLQAVFSRIWDTEDMPADTLEAHGLEATMSQTINRHRPVVVDFRFRK
jgi:hypothetical protein